MPKILLAEDERDLREFFEDELKDAEFSVVSVSNGAEAIVTAVDYDFDLAILDMMMPVMNGIQAIKVLRKVTPKLPIIGLTGYVGKGYMAEAARYGVTCLSKPIDIDGLLDQINETLQ